VFTKPLFVVFLIYKISASFVNAAESAVSRDEKYLLRRIFTDFHSLLRLKRMDESPLSTRLENHYLSKMETCKFLKNEYFRKNLLDKKYSGAASKATESNVATSSFSPSSKI
jgi:hypothetical protein